MMFLFMHMFKMHICSTYRGYTNITISREGIYCMFGLTVYDSISIDYMLILDFHMGGKQKNIITGVLKHSEIFCF